MYYLKHDFILKGIAKTILLKGLMRLCWAAFLKNAAVIFEMTDYSINNSSTYESWIIFAFAGKNGLLKF